MDSAVQLLINVTAMQKIAKTPKYVYVYKTSLSIHMCTLLDRVSDSGFFGFALEVTANSGTDLRNYAALLRTRGRASTLDCQFLDSTSMAVLHHSFTDVPKR